MCMPVHACTRARVCVWPYWLHGRYECLDVGLSYASRRPADSTDTVSLLNPTSAPELPAPHLRRDCLPHVCTGTSSEPHPAALHLLPKLAWWI